MMRLYTKLKVRLIILLDKIFLRYDKGQVLRSQNILMIPQLLRRVGGKISYAEWAHVIGVFQTLICQNTKESPQILDVGCGTGLLGIAAYNSISNGGSYTGIDVSKRDIDYCKSKYPPNNYTFIHLPIHNATYAGNQPKNQLKWDLPDQNFDLVTALSVWTHFNEEDAHFYIKEVSRVLKKDGKAIISFFILDSFYEQFLSGNPKVKRVLHNSLSLDWTFESKAYDSENWFTTTWAKAPEDAIALNRVGLDSLLHLSGLKIIEHYPGTWKGFPGLYFQDILVLQKG
ncbi:MAG: class I SAM-dependent methyltransferase [Ekhidna sp.]|jgi:SAM-dependent methyltransferase